MTKNKMHVTLVIEIKKYKQFIVCVRVQFNSTDIHDCT